MQAENLFVEQYTYFSVQVKYLLYNDLPRLFVKWNIFPYDDLFTFSFVQLEYPLYNDLH